MINLIKGGPGAGKTVLAAKLIGSTNHAACEVDQLENVLVFKTDLDYILLDGLTAEDVARAVSIYESFEVSKKPKLIICTQDMNVIVKNAKVVEV